MSEPVGVELPLYELLDYFFEGLDDNPSDLTDALFGFLAGIGYKIVRT